MGQFIISKPSEGSKSEGEALAETLREAQSVKNNIQSDINALEARWLKVFEHPRYLLQALASSQERIMILCPSVGLEAVDQAFVELLDAAMKRNVNVYIGHGRTAKGSRHNGHESVNKLEHMARVHKTLQIRSV